MLVDPVKKNRTKYVYYKCIAQNHLVGPVTMDYVKKTRFAENGCAWCFLDYRKAGDSKSLDGAVKYVSNGEIVKYKKGNAAAPTWNTKPICSSPSFHFFLCVEIPLVSIPSSQFRFSLFWTNVERKKRREKKTENKRIFKFVCLDFMRTMTSLGPSPFQFNIDDENCAIGWKNWLRGFELFAKASSIDKNPNKVEWLLTCSGTKVQEIYFNLPDKVVEEGN